MAPRARLGGLALLVSATLLSAPFVPGVAAVLAAVLVAAWIGLELTHRRVVEREFARYYEPPIARAADCLGGLVRNGARFLRRRRPSHAADALLCALYLALIVAPPVLVKAVAKDHGLGDPLGLSLGVVLWDVVLELANYPARLAQYRGSGEAPARPWIPISLLAAELGAFLVLAWTPDADSSSFLRSMLTGVAFMAAAHAVAVQSTVVAIMTGGRPLR
jgi:hypothetical protein